MKMRLFITNLHASQKGVEVIATNGGPEGPPSLWFTLPTDWVEKCKIGMPFTVNVDLED